MLRTSLQDGVGAPVHRAGESADSSLGRLERTCQHLSLALGEQEAALHQVQNALKEAVTKQHLELMFQDKLNQQDLSDALSSFAGELETLLRKKADLVNLEGLLQQKVSQNAMENLKQEVFRLRDSLRSGHAMDQLTAKLGGGTGGNPFDRYTSQMLQMIGQLKDEQEKQRKQAVDLQKELAEQVRSAAASRPGTSAGQNPTPTTGLPTVPAFDERERAALKERVHKLELAIQYVNAAMAAGFNMHGDGSKDGASGTAAGLDMQKMEMLLEQKTGKFQRALEEMKAKCTHSEHELEKLTKMMEARQRDHAVQATLHHGSGDRFNPAAMVQAQELTRFQQELDELHRTVTHGRQSNAVVSFNMEDGGSTGYLIDNVDSALQPWSPSQLSSGPSIPRSIASQAEDLQRTVEEIRTSLAEQNKVQTKLITFLDEARQGVTTNIEALYALARQLRLKVKLNSENFGRKLRENYQLMQGMYNEVNEWKSSVTQTIQELSAALTYQSSSLTSLSQPLFLQLESSAQHETGVREDELEERFLREYAALRERYEGIRAKRNLEEERRRLRVEQEAAQAEENTQRLLLRSAGGIGSGTSSSASASTASSPRTREEAKEPQQQRQTHYFPPQLLQFYDDEEGGDGRAGVAGKEVDGDSAEESGDNKFISFSEVTSPANSRPRTTQSPYSRTGAAGFSSAAARANSAGLYRAPLQKQSATQAAISESGQQYYQQQQRQVESSSASASRPSTSGGPGSGKKQRYYHHPSQYAYTPSPESSFQIHHPTQGPKWSRETNMSLLRKKKQGEEASKSPPSSARRKAGSQDDEEESPPASGLSSLYPSPPSSRPSTGHSMRSAHGLPSSARGKSAGTRGGGHTSATGGLMDQGDVNASLELLRQRLSIPAYDQAAALYAAGGAAARLPSSTVAQTSTQPRQPFADLIHGGAPPVSSLNSAALHQSLRASGATPLQTIGNTSLHIPFQSLNAAASTSDGTMARVSPPGIRVTASSNKSKSSRIQTNVYQLITRN